MTARKNPVVVNNNGLPEDRLRVILREELAAGREVAGETPAVTKASRPAFVHPAMQHRIATAADSLRDDIYGNTPKLAELVTEKSSPWHDGAGVVALDLLLHRGDHEALVLRILAWDAVLNGDV